MAVLLKDWCMQNVIYLQMFPSSVLSCKSETYLSAGIFEKCLQNLNGFKNTATQFENQA